MVPIGCTDSLIDATDEAIGLIPIFVEGECEMVVRCKMKCVEVAHLEHSIRRVRFQAVCADEVPENQRYHKYTPSGSVEIQVTNPDVNYDVGKSYYFDSVPVPESK